MRYRNGSYQSRTAENLGALSEHKTLFRDPRTGLAWIEDTSVGLVDSIHPTAGPFAFRVHLRSWRTDARAMRSHGYMYMTAHALPASGTPEDDAALRAACQCGGNHAI